MQKATSNNLTGILKKWNSRKVENPNLPFSSTEIREHFEMNPGRGQILNESPNRKARRFKQDNPIVVNCRKQTEGRTSKSGHQVLNRMSYFALCVQAYRMGYKIERTPNGGVKIVNPNQENQTQPVPNDNA